MIIPVNEQYRIATDPYQWMVEKARIRNGKKDWEPKLFYPSFKSALKGLGELMVRRSNAETLADALLDVNEIATTLSQALTPKVDAPSDSEVLWEIPE